jgi:hypothetical protein
MGTDPVSETSCFLEYRTWTKPEQPGILSIIRLHQNLLESTTIVFITVLQTVEICMCYISQIIVTVKLHVSVCRPSSSIYNKKKSLQNCMVKWIYLPNVLLIPRNVSNTYILKCLELSKTSAFVSKRWH